MTTTRPLPDDILRTLDDLDDEAAARVRYGIALLVLVVLVSSLGDAAMGRILGRTFMVSGSLTGFAALVRAWGVLVVPLLLLATVGRYLALPRTWILGAWTAVLASASLTTPSSGSGVTLAFLAPTTLALGLGELAVQSGLSPRGRLQLELAALLVLLPTASLLWCAGSLPLCTRLVSTVG